MVEKIVVIWWFILLHLMLFLARKITKFEVVEVCWLVSEWVGCICFVDELLLCDVLMVIYLLTVLNGEWFSDARQCFDLLYNSTLNTVCEPFFLSILQHLLTIRDDVTVRWESSPVTFAWKCNVLRLFCWICFLFLLVFCMICMIQSVVQNV